MMCFSDADVTKLSSDVSVMFMHTNEVSSHLFLHCPGVWKLWCLLFGIVGKYWVCPLGLEGCFLPGFKALVGRKKIK